MNACTNWGGADVSVVCPAVTLSHPAPTSNPATPLSSPAMKNCVRILVLLPGGLRKLKRPPPRCALIVWNKKFVKNVLSSPGNPLHRSRVRCAAQKITTRFCYPKFGMRRHKRQPRVARHRACTRVQFLDDEWDV